MASIWPVRINLQIVGAPSARRETDQVRDRVCARREREINPGNGERLHSFALHRRANCINVSLSRGGIAPRNSFQPRSKYVPSSSSSSSSPRVWCTVPPKAFAVLYFGSPSRCPCDKSTPTSSPAGEKFSMEFRRFD